MKIFQNPRWVMILRILFYIYLIRSSFQQNNWNSTCAAYLLFPHALTNAQDKPSCSNAVGQILLYVLLLSSFYFLLKTQYQPELKREEHLWRVAYCDYGMLKATDEAIKPLHGKRTCQEAPRSLPAQGRTKRTSQTWGAWIEFAITQEVTESAKARTHLKE